MNDHLSMETLLALREPGSEPGAAAAQAHLDACAVCRAELDRLHQRIARLKALPALRPGRDRWPEVRTRLDRERGERARKRGRTIGLALAASIVAVVVVGRGGPADPVELSATEQEITAAKERSQVLEATLDRYNPDIRVIDGRTARIADELQDRIATVDQQLEVVELSPEQAEREEQVLQLWRERVGLLDALMDVHVTRASNAGL